MHKPCPTCGDDGDKWAGQSGGIVVGDEGKLTVQCQACGTHATETTWNAPRSYERQIAALEAEVLTLRKDAERGKFMLKHGSWYRNDEKQQTRMAVLVPHGSDLSCYATRVAAIDAAIEAERGEG